MVLALQATNAVHLGVDNLNVVRYVGRLLDGLSTVVYDGDLIILIRKLLSIRGWDTVCISKVKGHADEVWCWMVGFVSLTGMVTKLLMMQLTLVEGGSVLLFSMLVVISLGSVCVGILSFLTFIGSSLPFLGPLIIMMGTMELPLIRWCGLLVLCLRGDDWFMLSVTWPCYLVLLLFSLLNVLLVLLLLMVLMMLLSGPTLLVFWLNGLPFLDHCIGPLEVWTLVLVVFLFVELLILYELWLGERLTLEKGHPRYLRPGRPISVSAVPFGPGIGIWRSCRFIGAMMRSLCMLPGGLGWFVPCSAGANHCRLRHVGWERCSHGLTSRPRESASGAFLDQLFLLIQYPPGSSGALLAGSLPLWCFSTEFARRVPFWTLPVPGHVAGLIAADVQASQVDEVEVAWREIHWVSGSCPGRKRIQLNRKTPAHLVGLSMHVRPRVWKRLHFSGFSDISGDLEAL